MSSDANESSAHALKVQLARLEAEAKIAVSSCMSGVEVAMARTKLSQAALEVMCRGATSHDPAHPPAATLTKAGSSFWASTGLYPQEFFSEFEAPCAVQRVLVECGGARTLELVRDAVSGDPGTSVARLELPGYDEDTQHCEFLPAAGGEGWRCATLRVLSGHGNFVWVRSVQFFGDADVD